MLICPIAPPNVDDYTRSMPVFFKAAWWAAGNSNFVLSNMVKLTAKETLNNPVKTLSDDMKHMSEEDYNIFLQNLSIQKVFVDSALEMYSDNLDTAVTAESQQYSSFAHP